MPSGRPREFDTEKALELATSLFWRKGYEGTSLSDLTETLGITRPSLYAAFGNKEALFRLVLERYEAKAGAYRTKRSKRRQPLKSRNNSWKGQRSCTAIRAIRSVAWACMVRWRAATKPT
jgi:AcrR family transcriptional regulator